MASNNTIYQFNNYTPNVFYVPNRLITTPYEQYPFLDHPSKSKSSNMGQVDAYGINCSTYDQNIEVYVPCMTNSMGDERYGIPEQEQPLDLCTDLLPSHPWLSPQGGHIKFVLSSVSNVARQFDLTISDSFEVHFVTRDTGYMVLKQKTVPIAYTWDRSVSTSVAFLHINFQSFLFADLDLELRASAPDYGTAYTPLGFCNYELHYKRCTAQQLLPHSVYSIHRLSN
jgi:hypothetical protein